MTPFVYRVISEARAVAAERPDGPLAMALRLYDEAVHAATKQAHAWATMRREASAAEDVLPTRDGSLPYVATPEQARDPLLSGCHAAGMTETQVIEILARKAARQSRQLEELALRDIIRPAATR